MSYIEQMLAELGDESYLKIRYDWIEGKGNLYSGFVYAAAGLEMIGGPEDHSFEIVMRQLDDLAEEWLAENT